MTRRCALPTVRRIAVCLLVLVVLVVAGCTSSQDSAGPTTSPPRTGRVQATPTGLTLDKTPWWPTGFNAYQLGTDWSVNRGCGAAVNLDDYFGRLPPRALTRFNLYSSFVVDKRTGLVNFGPLDAVIAADERHHQMLLPVLTSNEGACEDKVFKQLPWYVDGWRTTTGVGRLTYAAWLETAVTRWRGSRSIAGWELVGEPEPSMCTTSCAWQQRTCPSDAADVLRTFFDTAGAMLRSLDPTRPIFSGLVGGDQCGTADDDYGRVLASPGIDVADFHDYLSAIDASGPHGSDLPARLTQARAAGKPLVVNEIGIDAGSCLPIAARAACFRKIIADDRAAGVAGALLWAFVPDPRENECTYDIGPDDPAWRVVTDTAR